MRCSGLVSHAQEASARNTATMASTASPRAWVRAYSVVPAGVARNRATNSAAGRRPE
jgi:hypothetical protein